MENNHNIGTFMRNPTFRPKKNGKNGIPVKVRKNAINYNPKFQNPNRANRFRYANKVKWRKKIKTVNTCRNLKNHNKNGK